MLPIPLTELLEFQRLGIDFFVFRGIVIDSLANRALQFDEVFLGHFFTLVLIILEPTRRIELRTYSLPWSCSAC